LWSPYFLFFAAIPNATDKGQRITNNPKRLFMIFSSTLFLFLFLPLTLFGYYLIRPRWRNHLLLFASLVFFAWGGVSYTIILIGSMAGNYGFGLLIQKFAGSRIAYGLLCVGVFANLLLLGVYKYANFITKSINELLSLTHSGEVEQTSFLLPVGISFYTFHAISYLVDIYRHKAEAQRNILHLSVYIAMFPQLVAGPIIRYSQIWQQLRTRRHSWNCFAEGVERFLIGLGKKVLLANPLGQVADSMFSAAPETLGAPNAWLGITAYMLQLYGDFSGYSDMAIGLGKMFGFQFPENFNFPFMAQSIKEFWRRWHMSLSLFFRDYVYIPLGGNRVGKVRGALNLLLVFFLTGFWHGAAWTFMIWGLLHGCMVVLESLFLEKLLKRCWAPLCLLYTLLVVELSFVMFRAENAADACGYWRALFDFNITPEQMEVFYSCFNNEFVAVLFISGFGSYGGFNALYAFLNKGLSYHSGLQKVISFSYHIGSSIVYTLILLLSSMHLVAGGYNPFIYYRF
jgi:alginate O-acetyltransferase complex protein AlgI